jgi:hypothetical protein
MEILCAICGAKIADGERAFTATCSDHTPEEAAAFFGEPEPTPEARLTRFQEMLDELSREVARLREAGSKA